MTILKLWLAILPIFGFHFTTAQQQIALNPVRDAMVFGCAPCGYANSNYGGSLSFFAIAWTNNGHSSNARGLVQFDLSQLPSKSKIIKARLSLYHDPNDRNGSHSASEGSNAAVLQGIIEPWDESTVTWQNQPGTTDVQQVMLPESTDPHQHYTDIDVTGLIVAMAENPGKNYGLMLKMASEQPYRRLVFASRDHPDSRLHPTLHITYTKARGRKKK